MPDAVPISHALAALDQLSQFRRALDAIDVVVRGIANAEQVKLELDAAIKAKRFELSRGFDAEREASHQELAKTEGKITADAREKAAAIVSAAQAEAARIGEQIDLKRTELDGLVAKIEHHKGALRALAD